MNKNNEPSTKAISSKNRISFYSRNRYKILGLLIGMCLVFTVALISFNLFWLSGESFAGLGGDLILTLTRIAFVVVGTPVAIILFFIGHRMDDARNGKTYRYPLGIEIIGMIIGIVLGWSFAVLWAFILEINQGLIWANLLLYVPFPIVTPVITYLCFKGTQFVYSFINTSYRKDSFKPPLIIFVFSLPFLTYSGYMLSTIFQQASNQNTITLTNFKEVPQGNSYIFTADLSIPQAALYNITATIGPSQQTASAGTLRLNGIENIDRLNNYELNQGINRLIYYADNGDCPFTHTSKVSTYVTFKIRKYIDYPYTLTQPKVITQNITCHVL